MKKILLLFLILTTFLSAKGFSNTSKFGNDSAKCIQYNSLFHEFYVQKNYTDAQAPMEWVVDSCPKAYIRPFIEGEAIYKRLIQSTKDKAVKGEYFSKLMNLYDLRIKYHGQEGKVLGKKATSIYTYQKDYQKSYDLYEKAIGLTKDKTSIMEALTYFLVTEKLHKAGTLSQENLLNNFEKSYSMIEKQIGSFQSPKRKQFCQTCLAKVEQVFAPYADCETLTGFYTPKLKTKGEDKKFLEKAMKYLTQSKCEETEIFLKVTKKLHEIEPSATSSFGMAKLLTQKGDLNGAIEYIDQAIALETEDDKKANYYFLKGKIYHGKKNLQSVVRNMKKVLQYKSDWGEAYLTIGEAYLSAIPSYSGLDKNMIYILAVEQFQKAKSVDPNDEVKSLAGKKIATYKKYFPTQKDIFFDQLKVGDSYKIGGWIGKTVKIQIID